MEDIYSHFKIYEIDLLMNNKQRSVPELRNYECLLVLCFLVNIVKKPNQLNIWLQVKDILLINTYNHIKAFQKKLLKFDVENWITIQSKQCSPLSIVERI